MNDPFVVKIRKLSHKITLVSNEDIKELHELGFKLLSNIEDTITKTDSETGKNQLIANFKEIVQEYRHVERKLMIIRQGGLEDTAEILNAKEFLLAHDEVLGRLLQLQYDYYPEIAKKNLAIYKEFNLPLFRRVEKLQKNVRDENETDGQKKPQFQKKDFRRHINLRSEEDKEKLIEYLSPLCNNIAGEKLARFVMALQETDLLNTFDNQRGFFYDFESVFPEIGTYSGFNKQFNILFAVIENPSRDPQSFKKLQEQIRIFSDFKETLDLT